MSQLPYFPKIGEKVEYPICNHPVRLTVLLLQTNLLKKFVSRPYISVNVWSVWSYRRICESFGEDIICDLHMVNLCRKLTGFD